MTHHQRFGFLICLATLLGACNSTSSTIDDAPFRDGIGRYVQANNMAMKIKEIKQVPIIAGETATVKASMVHEQLEGPSVTWEFELAKQPNGAWEVIRHND